MTQDMKPFKPLPERTDDELRDRARELHQEGWVIEIPIEAKVYRYGDDGYVEIEAIIHLGEHD